ncbi:hypothetical protein T484DRAFT_1770397 [Baffinella frigidus]|nr:hypothetical protein T484DRAFT_1770397 [Cryptophyta sp. CCMP2293]
MQVAAEVAAGTVLVGTLRVNSRQVGEGFVSVAGHVRDLILDGLAARYPAFDGDTVAVRVCGAGGGGSVRAQVLA